MRLLRLSAAIVPFFYGSLTFGQELPNASQVAGNLGQAVEFQDEVKAVSYSKSTKGYYLSFGEPYPKQTLSVWIDRKIYDRLPVHSSMVGRTVRISGQIENSPTGPVMKLDSREHFVVQAPDEAILAKPKLDGKQDSAQFRTAVNGLFKREEFDTLETLAEELRQSRERLYDGSWLSEAFLNSFGLDPTSSSKRYGEVEQKIANWERAKPSSIAVPLVKAGFYVDRAWKWRGAGYADSVTPEGWKNFKQDLAVAEEILKSHPASKTFPEYFALMQTVALGQSWSRDQYERLFLEAVNTEPDYYTFYCRKAQYLLPRWHGRKGEWEDFAETERQRHGAGGAGDALYARIILSKRRYYKDIFRESEASWEVVASGMEYLCRQYPESRYLKSLYAHLAWKVGDRVRLAKLLPQIKSDPDMTVWVNLENVALAEKFAGIQSRQ